MASTTPSYDLLLVTNATGSMGVFLTALVTAIPEILALSQLSGAFSRLGIIAYHDYCDSSVVDWSGWNPPNFHEFAKSVRVYCGGGVSGATKSALAKALDEVDPSRNTLVLWYSDRPPHHLSHGEDPPYYNRAKEESALRDRGIDWCHLSYEALTKNCTVFSFLSIGRQDDARFYILLSQLTNGKCFNLERNTINSDSISQLTLDVLLSWLGQPPTSNYSDRGENIGHPSQASTLHFDVPPPKEVPVKDEVDSSGYLPSAPGENGTPQPISTAPLASTMAGIPQSQLSSIGSLTGLAKRFADTSEVVYRQTVYAALASIIDHNVTALAYNPIFGQLWRSVCKENSENKEELTNAFSLQVGKITNPTKKENMKAFIENSYDLSEKIAKIISRAPSDGVSRIYLDLDSLGPGAVNMTRMELLEVSRSCHSKVMAQLATIFTHLKLAPPDFALGPTQRSLPLSLPSQQIFQLMPHLVIPGTMFSARSSCIMAILSVIIGVKFLREPALEVLGQVKGKWLDEAVPENISYEFARFVLLEGPDPADIALRLTDEERAVYEGMRRYRLLELNLQAELNARVSWTPEKAKEVGDDKTTCKKCGVPRSKTMMSGLPEFEGVCGICTFLDEKVAEDWPNKGDEESCWVECSVPSCRAQYVILNVAGLRVKPKCWYCRNGKPCPHVECVQCKSRVVLPTYLRSSEPYKCVACRKGTRPTVVDAPAKLCDLVEENGVEWLGIPPNKDLFKNKSAFKLFQAHSNKFFLQISSINSAPTLTHRSRAIQNSPSIISEIERRVKSGTVDMGTCALCFDSMPHVKLSPSCGRRGCNQKADEECLRAWYGANTAGQLLHLMRTLCPFCRRRPSIKTLIRFNPRVGTLGGLQEAISDRAWYYGWCVACGFAKKVYERACCDGDRLPELANFRCDDCAPKIDAVSEAKGIGKINPCPSCGVMVEKTDGCNHITCQCGTHWCFACGKGFEADTIYGHMNEAHNGFYDDNDDDDEEFW